REQKQQQAPTIDEYIRYYDAACTPIVDLRAWWLEQKTTYPALAVMALDILSIPAMEAEPERLFSSAKATTLVVIALDILLIPAMEAEPERLFLSAKAIMTDKRNQMKAETLEALESLKSWLGGHSTAWLDSCAIVGIQILLQCNSRFYLQYIAISHYWQHWAGDESSPARTPTWDASAAATARTPFPPAALSPRALAPVPITPLPSSLLSPLVSQRASTDTLSLPPCIHPGIAPATHDSGSSSETVPVCPVDN
ncbi:hypothetical protein V501_01169, partial [Pseudogymnoascus sp. VKM F-4519 (FW-2642)]